MTAALPPSPGRRQRSPRCLPVLAAAALAMAAVASGCGGGGDGAAAKDAPVVTVATGLWPLAQAAKSIGQEKVRVVDEVPRGEDPRTYTLTTEEDASVRRAGVVLEMGGRFQPSLSRAARGARRAVTVGPGDGPDLWLDPYAMEAVSRVIERTLVAADPRAKTTFANGLDDFEAVLEALDEDYESILGDCPHDTLVAVDDAFGRLSRYSVHVVPVDGHQAAPAVPDAAAVTREVATVRHAGAGTVYDETWYPENALIPLQAKTGVKIGSLDTLEGVPPGGFPKGVTSYYGAMEMDLGVLSSALDCPNPEDEQ